MEEKLFSTSEYIGKQTLFFNFEEYYSRHSKPPFHNRSPPQKKNFLGGHYIGKNHFLQNGKINVVFLCVLMLWITFLLCILSIGSLWKSEISRDIVLLIYQIFKRNKKKIWEKFTEKISKHRNRKKLERHSVERRYLRLAAWNIMQGLLSTDDFQIVMKDFLIPMYICGKIFMKIWSAVFVWLGAPLAHCWCLAVVRDPRIISKISWGLSWLSTYLW